MVIFHSFSKKNTREISYLGKPARFELTTQGQSLREGILEYLRYDSTNPRSTFKDLTLIKYQDQTIQLICAFLGCIPNFGEYLKQYNIDLSKNDWERGYIVIKSDVEMRNLMQVLMKNNIFQPQDIKRIDLFFDKAENLNPKSLEQQ